MKMIGRVLLNAIMNANRWLFGEELMYSLDLKVSQWSG